MTLQSSLDLIEHSVSIEPNPRTKNSPSPPMTPKSSQAMIANGLAGLNFPLPLTHFFNTELPTTHPLSGLVVGYLLAPSKTTTPQPVLSLNFSSAGKGPFIDSKAKNMYFSKRGGVGAVEWGTWTHPGGWGWQRHPSILFFSYQVCLLLIIYYH